MLQAARLWDVGAKAKVLLGKDKAKVGCAHEPSAMQSLWVPGSAARPARTTGSGSDSDRWMLEHRLCHAVLSGRDYLYSTTSTAHFRNLDSHRDSLLQFFDVADDADLPAGRL